MNSPSKDDHILLLPFLAQGHLRPTLHLAHLLQHHTPFTITLLTTPLNATYLRRLTTTLNIIDLPFDPSQHNLPPGIENTEKLPLTSVISIFHASTSLELHFCTYLRLHHSNKPPLCIIFDVFMGWANSVAQSFGSTGICFNTCGAFGGAAYTSVWTHLPHRNISNDDEEFCIPGFPKHIKLKRNMFHRFLRFADGSDDWSTFFQPQIKMSMSSSGWLSNTVEEIEPFGFRIMNSLLNNVPHWGVGPLIMDPNEDNYRDDQGCVNWLNQFEKDSVLYISFGSQNTVSPVQMMELAKGLEESGVNFLWVIRPPFGFDVNMDFKPEWLPEGFEERMREKKKGKLVQKWGPQLEILKNEATGGFLTHCGWNSVLEALREGKPLIGWPLAAEQPYNSKMLVEEMKVGVELTRGLEGEVKKEGVKKVVEMVMDRKEGSFGLEMKRKAIEIGKKLKDALRKEGDYKGSSLRALDEFVEFIVSRKGKGGV